MKDNKLIAEFIKDQACHIELQEWEKNNQIPSSDCCGAETTETEMGICPDCLEHCEFTYEDDE
jgi:hypothetical protein